LIYVVDVYCLAEIRKKNKAPCYKFRGFFDMENIMARIRDAKKNGAV